MINRYKGLTEIILTINNQSYSVAVFPGETLLTVLRDNLGFTGPKAGCENGDCGACTVLLDGLPVKSCLLLAVEAVGKEVDTVEGLKDSPAARAFREKGAFQCGYCSAGFITNLQGFLDSGRPHTDDEAYSWLSANLCRCTGYESIKEAAVSAIKEAGKKP